MLKPVRCFLLLTLLAMGALSGCEQVVGYVNQNCSGGDGSFSCGSGEGND